MNGKGEIRREVVWIGETLEDVILALHGKSFSLGSFLSSPAISRGVLFIGSVDGTVYALGE